MHSLTLFTRTKLETEMVIAGLCNTACLQLRNRGCSDCYLELANVCSLSFSLTRTEAEIEAKSEIRIELMD